MLRNILDILQHPATQNAIGLLTLAIAVCGLVVLLLKGKPLVAFVFASMLIVTALAYWLVSMIRQDLMDRHESTAHPVTLSEQPHTGATALVFTPTSDAVTPALPTVRPEGFSSYTNTEATEEPIQLQVVDLPQQLHGPQDGVIVHDDIGDTLYAVGPPLELRDFTAEVQFYNPYDSQEQLWDYGLIFRSNELDDSYRLSIRSDARWFLTLVRRLGEQASFTRVADGMLANLNSSATGSNKLRLVVRGEAADFYLNDSHVATLDVSIRNQSGRVMVGTGFAPGHEIRGRFTQYEDFIIWGDAP